MSTETGAMRLRAIGLIVVVAVLALPGALAAADGHVQTFVDFDPTAGEFPEGIAVDKTGDVYVSLTPRDEIRRIDPSGDQAVVASFDEGTGPAGLAVDARGDVYTAAAAFDFATGQSDPARRGVYRVARDGETARLPGTESMVFPNDVALDPRGNVYATDTVEGAVWRIPTTGPAEPWAQHSLLEGTGALGFPFPIGANGIAFRHNRIIVANTERGLLVEIAVQPDGSAGKPAVIAEADALFGADGIALDVHGDLYVVSAAHTVTRVRHDGPIDTLATAGDGLNQPSTLAFGAGRSDNQTLFVANFSLFASEPTPAVLTLPVGEPGQPVP